METQLRGDGVMIARVEHAAQGKATEPMKAILFVEDNEDHFIIAWHQLRKLKIANVARRVSNVDDMIAYLSGEGAYHDRKENPLPAVIFLDLRLPNRDGLEAQAWLRSKLKYREIPIILISTPDMVPLLESAVRLGANAYMLKPFNGPDLQRLILEQKLPLNFAQS
jgi:CheY-like chemotaxis protein